MNGLGDEDIKLLADKHLKSLTQNKFTKTSDIQQVFIESLYDTDATVLCPIIVELIGQSELERLVFEGIADRTGGADDEDSGEEGWQIEFLNDCTNWLLSNITD